MNELFWLSAVFAVVLFTIAILFDRWAKSYIHEEWQRSIVTDKIGRMAAQRRRSDEARFLQRQAEALAKEAIKNLRRKAKVSKN